MWAALWVGVGVAVEDVPKKIVINGPHLGNHKHVGGGEEDGLWKAGDVEVNGKEK